MALDPLDIILRVIDEQALLALRQFGDAAKRTIQEVQQEQIQADRASTASAKEASKRRWEALMDEVKRSRAIHKETLAEAKRRLKEEAAMRKSVRKEIADEQAAIEKQADKEIERAFAETKKAMIQGEKDANRVLGNEMRQRAETAKALSRNAAKDILDTTKKRIADEKAETSTLWEQAVREGREIVAANQKAESDIVESAREAVRERRGIQEREIQERRHALRQEVREHGRATRERLAQFDEEVDQKRVKLRAMVADGRASGEDLLRFERQSAAERNILVQGNIQSILSLGQAWMSLRAAVHIGEMMRNVVRTIADETQRARDFMKEWSERMEGMREDVGELARIMGVKPTAEFAARQADQAALLGMRPREWSHFQKTFYDEVGGAIIPAEENQQMGKQAMVANAYKATQAEAAKFLKMAAPYAVRVEQLTPDQSARLAASVLRLAPTGASSREMFDHFVKLARMARRARGGTSQMIESIGKVAEEHARAGGEGDFKTMLEWGALTSVEAELNPANVVTATRAFDRWRRQARKNAEAERKKFGKSRLEQLGITPEMGVGDTVRQLNTKLREHLAGGGTEEEFWDKFGGGFQFSYTAVQAAGRRADIMDRVLREANAASGETALRETAEALADANQPGRLIAEQARTEAAGIRQAAQDVHMRIREQRALRALIVRGDLRETDTVIEAGRLKLRQGLGYGSKEQQLVREQMNAELVDELFTNMENPEVARFLKSMGIRMPEEFTNQDAAGNRASLAKRRQWTRNMIESNFNAGTPANVQSQADQILAKIAENTAEQTRLMKEQQRKAGAPVAVPRAAAPLPVGVPQQAGGARQ